MAGHRVCVRAFGASSERIAQFSLEVSTDSGATWHGQPLSDGQAVFQVTEGQPFRIRASRDERWSVLQELIARGGPNFDLTAVGAIDPGIAFDVTVCSVQADHLHMVDVYLTLFRDASDDLIAWERTHRVGLSPRIPTPAFPHVIIDFDGLPVTSASGPAVLEMAGPQRWTNAYGPGTGDLYLLHAPVGVRGPRLVATYVPQGVRRTEPIPFMTYFMPNARFPAAQYPYFQHIDTLNSYLTGGNRRTLNQVNCANKKTALFFPLLPSSTLHVPNVGTGAGLRSWLLEVAYWIRRRAAPSPRVAASLGRNAVASFSAGATALLDVVESGGFQELRELYVLDPSDHDNSNDISRSGLLTAWPSNGRMLRVYTQYGSWLGAIRSRFTSNATTGPGGSFDFHTAEASLTYLPQGYWAAAASHTGNLVHDAFNGAPVNSGTIHQRFPQFFLQHGLKNSGFANA